jgi:hypothetical protein
LVATIFVTTQSVLRPYSQVFYYDRLFISGAPLSRITMISVAQLGYWNGERCGTATRIPVPVVRFSARGAPVIVIESVQYQPTGSSIRVFSA